MAAGRRAHRPRPRVGQGASRAGAAVDLGGIGKGFAATRALDAMRATWPAPPGALVDLGGDIAVWGKPTEGGSSARGHRGNRRVPDGVAGTLELTSGRGRHVRTRQAALGPGGRLHHLIDPVTGAPATAAALGHGHRPERHGGRGPCDRPRNCGGQRRARSAASRPDIAALLFSTVRRAHRDWPSSSRS